MSSLSGSFLVARPILQDPNFVQTVVLLLKHGPEGAFGLVVNRPVESEDLPFPVFSGGPCPAPGLIMLHGNQEWAALGEEETAPEVALGVYIGDADCASRATEVAEEDQSRFRMFVGYSGWGPDQLERELAEGTWILADASGELLFDTPAEELWDRLSPPSVPRPSLN
jgi:putative transcriptional regulator